MLGLYGHEYIPDLSQHLVLSEAALAMEAVSFLYAINFKTK
jgi:hypothetical protein